MKKPFHKSIIDAINKLTSLEGLFLIGDLIIETKIPKNHEDIESAYINKWAEIMKDTSVPFTDQIRSKVLESLKPDAGS